MTDFMQGDPDKGAISVPFSDDETETEAKKAAELDEEDSPTATPQERMLRKDRRKARLQGILDEGKKNAERVRQLEERDAARERELAELRGAVAANQNAVRQQQTPAKDPYEAELDAIYAEQGNAYNAAQAEVKAGTFNTERQKYYEGVARQLETRKSAVHARRAVDADRANRQGEQARQVWVQKYPDVYNNEKAYQYAQATYQRRRALGEADSNQLVDDIMSETMTTFKLGPKTAPTANDRARMSGIPSAGGGGPSKGGSSGITMTPELRRMALAANPDLPEDKAIKKWVDGPGKRLRERKVL